MQKEFKWIASTVFAFGCLLLACNDSELNTKKQNNNINVSIEETEASKLDTVFIHELGAVRLNIEQAAATYKRLHENECPFNSNLVVNKEKTLNTSVEKATAFGHYASLFVYTSSFEQTQFAGEYLNELLDLSEDLGIRDMFNEKELDLLTNPDASIDKSAVLTKIYLNATERLYSEEKVQLVAYMVMGGWIEGMRISFDIDYKYLNDKNVALNLYDQTYGYYNCVRLLNEPKPIPSQSKRCLEGLEVIEPEIVAMVKSRGIISEELFGAIGNKIEAIEKQINSSK